MSSRGPGRLQPGVPRPGTPAGLRAGAADSGQDGVQVRLATQDDITPSTGGYWYHQRTRDPHPAARDPGFQDRLLHALAERTGVRLD
ncbi:hypothetical protein, partial [Streptomyces humi]|uniref:hypothetical protein n=1 Tax=Streptomyces humi TaxID=1428620 RepID=UPI00062885C2